jgi:hypothetical protein
LIENIDLRHRSNSNGSDALSENVGTDSMTALQQSLRNRRHSNRGHHVHYKATFRWFVLIAY